METGSVIASENRRVFVSDCEGPISKNDNAFELASHFIPHGDRFFSLVSKYDDVLADIAKREGYKAGDTLKLIVPFLRAYGATNRKMKQFSSENILLVPGADDMLRFVKGIMPAFIISTSYEHYIFSICEAIGFPSQNVYCTRLDIDRYVLGEDEIVRLRALSQEIAEKPMIEIPPNAKSIHDFCLRDQATVKRLDEIFWETIAGMSAGKTLIEINPVGGSEKAKAVQGVAGRVGTRLSDIMYVGDSITDVEPFRLVRENGGLTVSFNGNQYAIREAEIAVISNNAIVTSVLADVFNRFGKDTIVDLLEDWRLSSLKNLCNPELFSRSAGLFKEKFPRVVLISPRNMETLTKESTAVRKAVRGEAIGKLG